jgi:hypothetical protein
VHRQTTKIEKYKPNGLIYNSSKLVVTVAAVAVAAAAAVINTLAL